MTRICSLTYVYVSRLRVLLLAGKVGELESEASQMCADGGDGLYLCGWEMKACSSGCYSEQFWPSFYSCSAFSLDCFPLWF